MAELGRWTQVCVCLIERERERAREREREKSGAEPRRTAVRGQAHTLEHRHIVPRGVESGMTYVCERRLRVCGGARARAPKYRDECLRGMSPECVCARVCVHVYRIYDMYISLTTCSYPLGDIHVRICK